MKLKHLLRTEVIIVITLLVLAGGYSVYRYYNPASPSAQQSEPLPSEDVSKGIIDAAELARQQKYSEAHTLIDSLKAKATNKQDKYQLLAQQGVIYIQQKDYVNSYDVLKEALAISADKLTTQYNYGISAQYVTDYPAAIAAFEAAQKLQNDTTEAMIKNRVLSGITASRAHKDELKDYDPELVRLLGRYMWYERIENEDGMVRVYSPVAEYVSSKKIDMKVVDALRVKLRQLIFADLSAPAQ